MLVQLHSENTIHSFTKVNIILFHYYLKDTYVLAAFVLRFFNPTRQRY